MFQGLVREKCCQECSKDFWGSMQEEMLHVFVWNKQTCSIRVRKLCRQECPWVSEVTIHAEMFHGLLREPCRQDVPWVSEGQ
jgi:hypothetical protein